MGLSHKAHSHTHRNRLHSQNFPGEAAFRGLKVPSKMEIPESVPFPSLFPRYKWKTDVCLPGPEAFHTQVLLSGTKSISKEKLGGRTKCVLTDSSCGGHCIPVE